MSRYENIVTTADLLAAVISLEKRSEPKAAAGTSPWESLVNYGQIKAFRHVYPKNQDLYEYVVCGRMELSQENMVATIRDLEYRNSWDPYSKSLKVVKPEILGAGTDLVYWRVCYPFPFTDRDYLYTRYLLDLTAAEVLELLKNSSSSSSSSSVSEDDLKFYQLKMDNGEISADKLYQFSCSVPYKCLDPKSQDPGYGQKLVRVEEFNSVCIVTSSGDEDRNSCMLYAYIFDNPAGNIPSSFINWVTKTAVPKSFDSTKKAGEGYARWRAGRK